MLTCHLRAFGQSEESVWPWSWLTSSVGQPDIGHGRAVVTDA